MQLAPAEVADQKDHVVHLLSMDLHIIRKAQDSFERCPGALSFILFFVVSKDFDGSDAVMVISMFFEEIKQSK